MDVADGKVGEDISVFEVASWSGIEAGDPLDIACERERGRVITLNIIDVALESRYRR
jgi:hypothetical protein